MTRPLRLAVLALLGSCGRAADMTPRFSELEANVFRPLCANRSCHGENNPPLARPLGLGPGRAYGDLIGQPSFWRPDRPRVTPGAPESSFLVEKISSPSPSPAGMAKDGYTNQRMPQDCPELRDCLSAAAIESIRLWIKAGARND